MLHCRIFIPPTHFNVFPTDLSIPGWIFSMYYLSLLNTFSRCGELTTKPTLGLVLTDPFFLHCCNLPCPSNTSPLLSFDCVPETAANKTIMFSVLVFILTGVWPLWNPRKVDHVTKVRSKYSEARQRLQYALDELSVVVDTAQILRSTSAAKHVEVFVRESGKRI